MTTTDRATELATKLREAGITVGFADDRDGPRALLRGPVIFCRGGRLRYRMYANLYELSAFDLDDVVQDLCLDLHVPPPE